MRVHPRIRQFSSLLADEGFAIGVLATAGAAIILAYGFGAEAELIVAMLLLGVITALAETLMRPRNNGNDHR